MFFYLYSKLNYTKKISENDLKIILEDKEYESIRPIFIGLKPISVDNLSYDFFYKAIRIYNKSLLNEKAENETYKKNFLKDLKQ